MNEEEIAEVFETEPDGWLKSLPAYQRDVVKELTKTLSFEDAAQKWLESSFEETYPFGAVKQEKPNAFLQQLKAEIVTFLCGGGNSYKEERKKLAGSLETGRAVLVSTLSIAIAAKVGSSAVFLAPAIVLILAASGKMSLRAWCAVQEKK